MEARLNKGVFQVPKQTQAANFLALVSKGLTISSKIGVWNCSLFNTSLLIDEPAFKIQHHGNNSSVGGGGGGGGGGSSNNALSGGGAGGVVCSSSSGSLLQTVNFGSDNGGCTSNANGGGGNKHEFITH